MVVVIACYRIGARLDWFDAFWVGPCSFLLAAASIPFVFSRSNWTCIFVMLGAIPFAVISDAVYDFFMNRIDRNLLPLEIVFWWVITPIPSVIGYGLGRYFAPFLKTR